MAKPSKLDVVWAENGTSIDPGDTKTELGWVAEIPPYQHLNYITNKHSAALAHLNEFGSLEWDTLTNYAIKAKVRFDGIEYISSVDDNLGNTPDISGTWYPSPAEAYDYVIGSDQDLDYLLGSYTIYNSVLVLPGTYTIADTLAWYPNNNLTHTIQGLGRVLIKGACEWGLIEAFPGLPEDDLFYRIDGISVTNIGISGSTECSGFNGFFNMANCNYFSSYDDTNASETIVGFLYCFGLTDCHVYMEDVGSDKFVHGFHSCFEMVNCSAYIQSAGGSNTAVYGFRSCHRIVNCKATVGANDTNGTGYAFNDCNLMANIDAKADASASGVAVGLQGCDKVFGSYSIGSSQGTGHGYRACTGLVYPDGLASDAVASGCTGIQTESVITL